MTAELNRMSMRLSERSKALQIWDTGSGIAEDQQEKNFEEFYQIDNQARSDGDSCRSSGARWSCWHAAGSFSR
jgi:K+-sensing histidine kinase KdpD